MRQFLAFLLLLALPTIDLGGSITQDQSMPLTQTDWTEPLTFNAFNPADGTLTNIEVTMSMDANSYFMLMFPSQQSTLYITTTATIDTTILDDPSAVAKLSDGPSAALYGPDGTSLLLNQSAPVAVIKRTDTGNTWSSFLPPTDPHYSPPQLISQGAVAQTFAGGLADQFIGTSPVDLDVKARAISSFVSSTGNGGGAVLTDVGVSVTLTYNFVSSAVPEPASVVLLCLGVGCVI